MTTAPPPPTAYSSLRIWRCCGCGRIIMRATLPPGTFIQVKCRDCNAFTTIEIAAAAQQTVDVR